MPCKRYSVMEILRPVTDFLYRRRPTLLVLVLLISAGCDSQRNQDDFADEAGLPAGGFTATDETGQVLKDGDGRERSDADDWRTAPRFQGDVTVRPLYPNPVTNTTISLEVLVRFGESVRGGLFLTGRAADGGFFRIAEQREAQGAGLYILQFSPTTFPAGGLYRIFLFDGSGEIISYGDVKT